MAAKADADAQAPPAGSGASSHSAHGSTHLPPLFTPVVSNGDPLYVAVRDAILTAIDEKKLPPGERVPSTADLAKQFGVSLVTAHRALGELVNAGVLLRSQGRGTFVDRRYGRRQATEARARIGLVFHAEASLADHYHGHLLEGVRRASHELHADLMLLRFGEDVRNECAGFLYVNPLPSDLTGGAGAANRDRPVVVVGAASGLKGVASVDTNNRDLAAEAARRLVGLGHHRILFVGDREGASNSRDRWLGFESTCRELGVPILPPIDATGWRLDATGKADLTRRLQADDRPTAIFAVGYYFALDTYEAAAEANLMIGQNLAVVGVDDPPSAEFLSPPLTTLRQPLEELGFEALRLLMDLIAGRKTKTRRTLAAEWLPRESTQSDTA
jgi:LacI family transcriptional regulator